MGGGEGQGEILSDGRTDVSRLSSVASAMDSCGSSRRSSASSAAAPSASSVSDNDDWFDEVDTCGLEDEQVRMRIYRYTHYGI